jgi:transcriptional regulator with XRE-family HTH domain
MDAAKLRRYTKAEGVRLRELSAESGIPADRISKIFTGYRSARSGELEKIESAFGLILARRAGQ